GGCGKTRLALRVAADVSGGFADGVRLVELAALADPALVPRAVASARGAPEIMGQPITDSLVSRLRAKTMLVVLDNCEHLVTAAAELVDILLRSCAGLHILATSREALASPGETTLRVPSLALPPEVRLTAEDAQRFEAVRLFIERALAALPG